MLQMATPNNYVRYFYPKITILMSFEDILLQVMKNKKNLVVFILFKMKLKKQKSDTNEDELWVQTRACK